VTWAERIWEKFNVATKWKPKIPGWTPMKAGLSWQIWENLPTVITAYQKRFDNSRCFRRKSGGYNERREPVSGDRLIVLVLLIIIGLAPFGQCREKFSAWKVQKIYRSGKERSRENIQRRHSSFILAYGQTHILIEGCAYSGGIIETPIAIVIRQWRAYGAYPVCCIIVIPRQHDCLMLDFVKKTSEVVQGF